MKKSHLFITFSLMISALVGCAPLNQYHYVPGKVNIVTTTTMLGDLAKVIGGDSVNVFSIMKPGVNPHSYNPKPSDARALSKADLVVLNGLHLEAKMGDVLLSIHQSKRLIASDILETLNPQPIILTSSGQHDPHIWNDINNWKYIATSLKDKLIEIDDHHQAEYETNLVTYHHQLDELNLEIEGLVSQIDVKNRVLITAHDAFAYLGRAYGFEVHSIQGISTQSEASVKDIQDLANLVVSLNVKAIFVETSVPENTIRSVIEAVNAQGKALVIGGHLYSDSLGDEQSGADTYITMYRHNMTTIVDALR